MPFIIYKLIDTIEFTLFYLFLFISLFAGLTSILPRVLTCPFFLSSLLSVDQTFPSSILVKFTTTYFTYLQLLL